MAEVLELLQIPNPFEGFPFRDYTMDLQGGHQHEVVAKLIAELRPRITVEVGSWKVASAIRLAKLLEQHAIDGVVICVDTWLGSTEHWSADAGEWSILPYLKHGYPILFHQFLANVMHSNQESRILPTPNTSANAAR